MEEFVRNLHDFEGGDGVAVDYSRSALERPTSNVQRRTLTWNIELVTI